MLLQAQLNLRQQLFHRDVSLRSASGSRPSHVLATTSSQSIDDTEAAVHQGWDPEHLLSQKKLSKGLLSEHTARRAARQAANSVDLPSAETLTANLSHPVDHSQSLTRTASLVTDSCQPLSCSTPGQEIAANTDLKRALGDILRSQFWPIDLDAPGVEALHLDPPILRIPNYLTPQACETIMQLSAASGLMQASKIGGDNVAGAGSSHNIRRTSSTMLLTDDLSQVLPQLAAQILPFQNAAQKLAGRGGRAWGRSGRMPSRGQRCFESAQIAEYREGQQFMAHEVLIHPRLMDDTFGVQSKFEDAFPVPLAERNGFQRHATVLVYLNDAIEGGFTTFQQLGVAVQPQQGAALVFFPSFKDGRPDPRTVHSAEPAVSRKWILQQWIVQGWEGQPGPQTSNLPPIRSLDDVPSSPPISSGTNRPPSKQARSGSAKARRNGGRGKQSKQ